MQDSAVASIRPAARQASSTSSCTGRSSSAKSAAPNRDRAPARARPARTAPPSRVRRSTWISRSRAQTVISTPWPSPPLSAIARATADSLGPKKRRTRCSLFGMRARIRPTDSWASAAGQSRRSSPGGPGSATATRPSCSSRTAGAVPARPRETAPAGRVACFTIPSAKSAKGLRAARRCPATRSRSPRGATRRRRALSPWRAPGARSSGRRGSGRAAGDDAEIGCGPFC